MEGNARNENQARGQVRNMQANQNLGLQFPEEQNSAGCLPSMERIRTCSATEAEEL